MAINKAWHEAHRMPTNATLDQRIAWHREHTKACGCRDMPASVRRAIDERGRRAPKPRTGYVASLAELRNDLRGMATPERAKSNAWYFKTGPGQYGEGDTFVGLTVPQVRALATKYRDLSLSNVTQLLHSPVHEERLLALEILVARYRRADAPARRQIHELYRKNTRYVNNWDLVDASAAQLVGAHLDGRPKRLLDRLAASESLWERRIAIIATHAYLRSGDPAPALRIAETLIEDGHDLIQKAVGWTLRETGKRCGRRYLSAFLDRHAATMPRTALRYALEHFDAKERAHYMGMRVAAKERRVAG